VVGDLQIGIASSGIDYNCQDLNSIASIRRYIRWIENNKALLEGKVIDSLFSKTMEKGLFK
jgi:hypothetical protein